MMKLFQVLSFAIVSLGLLAGCVKTTTAVMPEITFSHIQPYKLAVSQVRVEQSFVPSSEAPHVEMRINQPPIQAMRRWAKDRLTVSNSNSSGFARFVIIDASVTEQPLDTDGNITAFFTNEQSMRYVATAEALLEIQSDDGLSKGGATARVSKALTLAEKSTLNEREQALFNLVEGLMKEFNVRMDESIRAHLSKWLE